jgi:xanthine dehydrogenase accessory factor
MAFADAWWDGAAELDGLVARLARFPGPPGDIALHARPLAETLATLAPAAIVDARMAKHAHPEPVTAAAPVIGLGPGFAPGANCALAVETRWGPGLGTVLATGATAALQGEPRAIDGVGRARFVYAGHPGTLASDRRIGEPVRRGEPLGTLDGHPFFAPLDGTLRGLARPGLAVLPGDKIAEVDPRPPPRAVVAGLGERPRAVAAGVAAALARLEGPA